MQELILQPNNLPAEYKSMLVGIKNRLPAAIKGAENYHKSHSQFMNVTLDITAITPIRSIKHTLAEIERTRAALQEASINLKKYEIKIRQNKHLAEEEQDSFKKELLELKISKAENRHSNTMNSMLGAVRKLNGLLTQYNNLLDVIGKDEITEEEYEREEARYHIMTCMKQGLNAARSRGGFIDEGNLIYLFDLGINAAQAQAEVTAYLAAEEELMSNKKAPTHEMTMRWLEACADKWEKDPEVFANRRGFTLLDTESLATRIEDKT